MKSEVSLCVLICTLASCVLATVAQGKVTRLTPVPGKSVLYLKTNDRLELHCEANEEAELYNGFTKVSGKSGFRSYNDGTKWNVKLTIAEVKPTDKGQYICRLKNKPAITDSLQIYVINVTAKNDSLQNEHDPVTIGCTAQGINGVSSPKWFRKGKEITAGNSDDKDVKSNYNISTADNTLTINSASRKSVGRFDCVFFPAQTDQNVTGYAYVESAPYVDKFERSKNLVQGDTLKVECKAYGFPVPTVTWFRLIEEDRKMLSGMENRTKISTVNGIPNAKLEISELVMEDGGHYGCEASNNYNATSAKLLVRVKDKYAALWPFLGIVFEVVVLCVIIFIYEKKRGGKRHEDDDATPVEKTNSHDHKADDLRQRNKNVKA